MVSEIKLTNSPNQTYSVTIPGDTKNISLTITQSYNAIAGYWVMGIYEAGNGKALAVNIPMLTGANLLGQLGYLGLGAAYVVNVGDQTLTDPDASNIGDNFVLVWELS